MKRPLFENSNISIVEGSHCIQCMAYISELEKFCDFLEQEQEDKEYTESDEDRLRFLDALETAGVDNWEGYAEAVVIYNEGNE